jgi:hypothetical protein
LLAVLTQGRDSSFFEFEKPSIPAVIDVTVNVA